MSDTHLRSLERSAAHDPAARLTWLRACVRANVFTTGARQDHPPAWLSESSIDRQQVELVFGLTGGELEDEPWDGHRYWYEGRPDYADHLGNRDDYRTVVTDCLFGYPDDPDGWEQQETFRSSGETECWCSQDDETDTSECPLCEGGGYVYLGDGWTEIVYRRTLSSTVTEYLEEGVWLSPGACPGCEECFGHLEDPDSPTEAEQEEAGEGSFSRSTCESCGSGLGGDRYPAHAVIDGDVYHYDICVDCVQLWANGEEPVD